jgi:hypothetical protein
VSEPADTPDDQTVPFDRPVPPLRQQILWLCMVLAALVVVLTTAGLAVGLPKDDKAELRHTAVLNVEDMQAQSALEQEQQTLGRLDVRTGGPHTVAKLLGHALPGFRVIVGTSKAATDTKTVVVGPGSSTKRFAFYLRSQSGVVWRLDGTPTTLLSMSHAG